MTLLTKLRGPFSRRLNCKSPYSAHCAIPSAAACLVTWGLKQLTKIFIKLLVNSWIETHSLKKKGTVSTCIKIYAWQVVKMYVPETASDFGFPSVPPAFNKL